MVLSRLYRSAGVALMLIFVCLVTAPLHGTEPRAVSFRNDVMAVLSKAGCNQGTCHGNANGKAGFKLSLREADPAADLAALTHDQFSRRIDTLRPDQSLILLKATSQTPHGGGKRFDPASPEYETLRRWIAAGLPADPAGTPRLVKIEASPREQIIVEPASQVALKVQATFSDGTTRDVSRWAVYTPSNPIVAVSPEGLVRRERDGETAIVVRYLDRQATVQLAFVPARPKFTWHDEPSFNYIDEHVLSRLKRLRMNPSELASDTVFLRRAYLDLLGVLPTAAEAQAFLADAGKARRAALVDRLLTRPEFADHWALKWSDLLRNEEKVIDFKGVQNFHQWIRQSILANQPVNEFVYDLVAARGSTYSHPAANFYRGNRDPVTRAEAAAQVFLGVRLQCAKCHNHPFDRWTQADYYSWAGLFARVQYKIVSNKIRDKNDKKNFDGEQVVWMSREGEVTNPATDEPAAPKFLGAETPKFGEDDDRLEALAAWLAGHNRENSLFAKTQVNRIWFHLLGRGIVEPIDDFRATNPPSNGPLLDALTRDFVESGYDLRHVIRRIMASRMYQLSAVPNDTNRDDEANFSHALLRPLEAEQLLDAINQVAGTTSKFHGYPDGVRAGQLAGVRGDRARDEALTGSEVFLEKFGKPPRLLTCECERSTETTLGQAFQLISGPTIHEMLARPDNRLQTLLDSGRSSAELVDELFWSALSRGPNDDERRSCVVLLDKAKDRRLALEDVVWSLVNAKEFLLRQ